MNFFIISFLVSLLVTLSLVRYQHLHKKLSSDHDFSGPQKFHKLAVPRIGGVGIFLGIFVSGLSAIIGFNEENGYLSLQLIAYSLPAFLIGLLEDVTKKIGVKTRLIAISISACLVGHFLNSWVTAIHVPGIDWLLGISAISIIFTIIGITGLANAYNIIDGFNGLASMVGMISLSAIGYVAFKVNDPVLASTCFIILGSISGFFVWNYPRGIIFLGDGGAYLIGFLIACLSVLLVQRNLNVSPWFVLLVNAYPIFETLFTIWRRKIHQGKNPSLPDGAHFHSLIYRRLIRWAEVHETEETASYLKNAKTSPYLWVLSSIAVFPAIIWWQTTWVLQCFSLLFCIFYVWTYNAIVKFKTPGFFNCMK
jgi:UDP-GlcNAc:undecaprenyl-phosphate GlcNAc-1-phosphate transferase